MPHAAEMTHVLRRANLPVAACWGCSSRRTTGGSSPCSRTGMNRPACPRNSSPSRSVRPYSAPGKLAFGVPKLLLIENDIDIADPKQVIWAFASRAHPEHGEIHFANEPQNILPIYLDAHERLSYHATKIVHNCLIADRFDKNERPTPSDLTHAWPADIRQHVIDNWQTYGYR